MALVVESTSTVATSNADNLTLTKASGVATGDLLLIIVSGRQNVAPTISTFTSILDQYADVSGGGNAISRLTVFYRIADSTDVAASNYTIALTGTDTLGAATMFRISGWVAGNPIFASYTNEVDVSAANPTIAQSVSLTKPVPSLIIQANSLGGQDNETPTFATYQITSGESNPTWTEVQDAQYTTNNTTTQRYNALSVAYTATSNTSTITNYGVVITKTAGSDTCATALIVICEPTNAQGTNALLSVSPTIFTNTAVEVGTIGTNTLLSVSPTIPTQSGSGDTPTTWTTINKT